MNGPITDRLVLALLAAAIFLPIPAVMTALPMQLVLPGLSLAWLVLAGVAAAFAAWQKPLLISHRLTGAAILGAFLFLSSAAAMMGDPDHLARLIDQGFTN